MPGGNNNQNLRPIKKGTVLNPLGASAHKTLHGPLKKLTREQLAELATMILEQNVPSLQKMAESKTSSTLQVWTAKIALTAIRKGDVGPWEVILNRICGKPKERVEHDIGPTLEQLIVGSMQKKPLPEVRDVNALPMDVSGVPNASVDDNDDEFLK